jgi:hypothetical protein
LRNWQSPEKERTKMPRTERLTVRSVLSEQIKRLRILSVILDEPMPDITSRMIREFCDREEAKLNMERQVA